MKNTNFEIRRSPAKVLLLVYAVSYAICPRVSNFDRGWIEGKLRVSGKLDIEWIDLVIIEWNEHQRILELKSAFAVKHSNKKSRH